MRRKLQVYQKLQACWHGGLPLSGRSGFASGVLGVEVGLDALYELTTLAAEA